MTENQPALEKSHSSTVRESEVPQAHRRHDGRGPESLRPISFERHFTRHAGGSVLVSFGATRVLCTAMIERDLPPWLKAKGPGAGGWLTAEYAMLPSSTPGRKRRDAGKTDGRAVEIQRLIGRALRSCIDLGQLQGVAAERRPSGLTPGTGAGRGAGGRSDGLTLFVDCDVLQADGGTRTAAITGAWVAVADAVAAAKGSGLLPPEAKVLINQVAAVSVGILSVPGGGAKQGGVSGKGPLVVDLDYEEDVEACVDMNVAMLADHTFVEVQGTGEQGTFTRAELDGMLQRAAGAIGQLHAAQKAALGQ